MAGAGAAAGAGRVALLLLGGWWAGQGCSFGGCGDGSAGGEGEQNAACKKCGRGLPPHASRAIMIQKDSLYLESGVERLIPVAMAQKDDTAL